MTLMSKCESQQSGFVFEKATQIADSDQETVCGLWCEKEASSHGDSFPASPG